MDNLQDLADFVMQHGGIFVRRDIRAHSAHEDSAGEWKPIFAYTVPGYEQMDIEASIAW